MNDISFKLSGLSCEACVKLVSSRFRKVPGVRAVSIDLASGEAKVSGAAALDLGVLEESLKGLPYSIIR